MNILILCTYPICNPRHGGQLRVKNMVEAYLAAGLKVEVAGVLGSDQYDFEMGFEAYPRAGAFAPVIENSFLMEDYAIGRLFVEDDRYYQRLSKQIRISPDIIQVEHPWLFSFARRYMEENNIKAKLIYSSHNVEWKLKKDIVTSCMGVKYGENCSSLIKPLEEESIAKADAIFCVSESDRDWIRSQTIKEVVLAPNGVSDWLPTEVAKKEAFAITKNYKYALYCASAHPPNVTGFFDMFSGGFGSLKPDEKLVVAGGAGWAIAQDVRVHQSAKLAEKVVVAGVVSQPCLEGLLDGANCIVLPLTQGGGTNLKTAEALWAGKHIVATSIAMRGFEKFIGSEGVYIADNATDFKRKLRFAMAEPVLKLSAQEREKRRAVLWSSCLEPIVKLVKEIEKKPQYE